MFGHSKGARMRREALSSASRLRDADLSTRLIRDKEAWFSVDEGNGEWQRYYAVLGRVGDDFQPTKLYYFRSEADGAPRGVVALQQVQVELLEEVILLSGASGRSLFFCAESRAVATDWASAMCLARARPRISSLEVAASRSRGPGTPATAPSQQSSPARSLAPAPAPAPGPARSLVASLPPLVRAAIDLRENVLSGARGDAATSAARFLREHATLAASPAPRIRSVCWRVVLGLLSADVDAVGRAWLAQVDAQRSRYEALRHAHTPDMAGPAPRPQSAEHGGRSRGATAEAVEAVGGAGSLDAAPSGSAGQPGAGAGPAHAQARAQAQAQAREREQEAEDDLHRAWAEALSGDRRVPAVCADLKRTQPYLPFLHTAEVQWRMLRVLRVYAATHPAFGVKQGMTELLASVLLLLHTESAADAEGGQGGGASARAGPTGEGGKVDPCLALSRRLLSPSHVEHDAFALLEALLARLAPHYDPDAVRSRPPGRGSFSGVGDGDGRSPRTAAGAVDAEAESRLVCKLSELERGVLPAHAPEAAARLRELDLPAAAYMVKWLRLLFAQEFDLIHVWRIWDAVFADTPDDFELVDYVAAALVYACTEELRACRDAEQARDVVARAGRGADVRSVIRRAQAFREGGSFYASPTLPPAEAGTQ